MIRMAHDLPPASHKKMYRGHYKKNTSYSFEELPGQCRTEWLLAWIHNHGCDEWQGTLQSGEEIKNKSLLSCSVHTPLLVDLAEVASSYSFYL